MFELRNNLSFAVSYATHTQLTQLIWIFFWCKERIILVIPSTNLRLNWGAPLTSEGPLMPHVSSPPLPIALLVVLLLPLLKEKKRGKIMKIWPNTSGHWKTAIFFLETSIRISSSNVNRLMANSLWLSEVSLEDFSFYTYYCLVERLSGLWCVDVVSRLVLCFLELLPEIDREASWQGTSCCIFDV